MTTKVRVDKTLVDDMVTALCLIANFGPASILVMVEEKRSCSQLKEYVSARSTQSDDSNMTPILSRLARNYFRWKAGIAQINQQLKSELKDQTSGARGFAGQSNLAMRGKAPPNKRRRVRGASAIAAASEAFARPLADTFQQDIVENIDA